MTSVTVTRLSEDVIEQLRALARQHQRSVEAEARAILEEHLTSRQALATRIEHTTAQHARSTTADEVDNWIRATRERTI